MKLTDSQPNTSSIVAAISGEFPAAQPSKTSLVIDLAPWDVENFDGVTREQMIEKYEGLQEREYHLRQDYTASQTKCGDLEVQLEAGMARLRVQETEKEKLAEQLEAQTARNGRLTTQLETQIEMATRASAREWKALQKAAGVVSEDED